jgi:protoporphyrinogen oxidase
MMWEAAAKKMKAMGGRILMDHALERLTYDEARALWTIEVMRGDGTRERLVANEIVSSAPIRELMSALKPTPLSLLHARELRYRDFLTVVLIGRCQRDLPDNWIYIHDETVKVGRVQNFRSWSPDMIPDGVSTCLGLEYFCFEGDGLWSAEDADLIVLAKSEIARIGLMRAEDVRDACVVRQAKAYPVYDEQYADNVAVIRRELCLRFPSLHLVGRNGMHKYNNQDHAMMTGMLTAANILAGQTLYDVWQVNEDAEYSEAGFSGAEHALQSDWLVPHRAAATRAA